MTTEYTNSKGEKVEIAKMVYNHLKAAHDKAVRAEERRHENAVARGETYENDQRESEIESMAAELAKRNLERDRGI